ncbi:MAG TPA: two-component sensor histidine kinase, partial [Acidimicrobiia bacterium]
MATEEHVHISPYPGRFGLGLRARAVVAFGLIAFTLSGVLSLLSYQLTRNYLLDQRQSAAMRTAYVNARLARDALRTPDPNVPELLAQLQSASNSVPVLLYRGRPFASTVGIGLGQVPLDLRQAVLDGRAGRQRFKLAGQPQVAVGVPLPAAEAFYFELVPLTELDRTLSLLARALAVGATLTALGGAAVGAYASLRVVRPLKGIASAAS